jgi:hypothetical protein
MKTKNIFFLFILLFAASCQDKITENYTMLEPVYMNYDEFRASVKDGDPQEIVSPGKIYMWKNYILINQPEKGIHVIDNSNPENPVAVNFINILGNIDMAVKDDILYADSYMDLVVLDISDINNVTEVGRLENVFDYILPQTEQNYPIDYVNQEQGVVVGYTEKVVERDYYEQNRYIDYYVMEDFGGWNKDNISMNSGSHTSVVSNAGTSVGVGGSMARFAISENALYVIDKARLMTFDISIPATPEKKNEVYVSFDVETIFPLGNYLYIGAQTGMHIFSIANLFEPAFVSTYSHLTSCDPVVVQGNYAYVTLRSGTMCNSTTNSLEVIDVSNLLSPQLIKAYDMVNPHGLGIDSAALFVCDGTAGLKIFNASDVMNITSNQIAAYPDINTFDVIPANGLLILIGSDGLYQYDYSNLTDIKYLSKISVEE